MVSKQNKSEAENQRAMKGSKSRSSSSPATAKLSRVTDRENLQSMRGLGGKTRRGSNKAAAAIRKTTTSRIKANVSASKGHGQSQRTLKS